MRGDKKSLALYVLIAISFIVLILSPIIIQEDSPRAIEDERIFVDERIIVISNIDVDVFSSLDLDCDYCLI